MWADFCSDSKRWTEVQWPCSTASCYWIIYVNEDTRTDPENVTQCFITILIFTFVYFLAFQSKPWWKLKTIVHWPFSATQRRKLNWVQLAGHKGTTCSDHITHCLWYSVDPQVGNLMSCFACWLTSRHILFDTKCILLVLLCHFCCVVQLFQQGKKIEVKRSQSQQWQGLKHFSTADARRHGWLKSDLLFSSNAVPPAADKNIEFKRINLAWLHVTGS